MEWPLRNIVFSPMKNNIEFGLGLKISFSMFVIVIIIMGLIVHRRILSFLNRNTGMRSTLHFIHKSTYIQARRNAFMCFRILIQTLKKHWDISWDLLNTFSKSTGNCFRSPCGFSTSGSPHEMIILAKYQSSYRG